MKNPRAHLLILFVIAFALTTHAQSTNAGANAETSAKALIEGLVSERARI